MDTSIQNVPYTIDENKTFGRFLIASRNVKQGEIIIKEKPALIGSTIKAMLICFKCMRHLHTSFHICENCKIAPLCTKLCAGNFHTDTECQALKTTIISTKDIIQNPQIVLPLRALLLRKHSPEIWQKFSQLEPHLAARRDTFIWRAHEHNVARILKDLNVTDDEDAKEEIMQKICGILDVNSFEVRPREFQSVNGKYGGFLRAVYLEAALMAHDCVCNTHVATDDDFEIVVRASKDIGKGETIFFNYSNVLEGTLDRRLHLKEGKYFECFCIRCLDPTELNTEISSLKCRKCNKGIIRNNIPENNWKCTICEKIYNQQLINSTLNEARRQIEAADLSFVVEIEKLLQKFKLTFYENHYLILELEQNLIALYTQNTPNIANLQRKIKLCKHLLSILHKIEVGISRLEGITMYELQSAESTLAKLLHTNRSLTDENFVISMLRAEETLKGALKSLLYEPPNSPEGRLAQAALKELKFLREEIRKIENKRSKKMTERVERELKNVEGKLAAF